ncbi:cysteine synthase A [Sulfoacidibacillus ferrooxidans]|uniref:Cysteine synthase n=1 Tax=Sulfoacidibacillus ferrooxidans TaxID=2005001 RepID=A0A9X2ADS0_9BACL|nr:Cysteine synthase [Sulfoacidibacillus ferrooxidans]
MIGTKNILQLIGKTPIVQLQHLVDDDSADVFVKLEWFNPGGSIKDRVALSMVEAAEKAGLLTAGKIIVEPTSGNTGIGLALVGAAKGYKVLLVMPETMSVERRSLLRAYGADLMLTPGALGMRGAIEKAGEIVEQDPLRYYMPQQFDNPANVAAHRLTTGPEIVEQMDGTLDAFVSAVGTGGTLTGIGTVLRERIPGCKLIAVEPATSPVLSGGQAGPHKIQGIGAGFVPSILQRELMDRIMLVTDEESFITARRLAREEGLLVGISSGAAVSAALHIAKELGKGHKVLTISASNGERYLSTPLFQEG